MTSSERRAVFIVSALYIFRMLGLFMILPVLTVYSSEIKDATPVLLGLVLGGYGLTQAIFQIPMGWLSDIFGRKCIIIIGLLFFFLGSILAATSSNIYVMLLGRILQGIGAIAGSVMALIVDNTREAQRTKAMAIVGSSIGVSFLVAILAGPAVAAFWGISGIFYVTAFLSLLGIILAVFGISDSNESVRGRSRLDFGSILSVSRDSQLQHLYFAIFCLHFTLTASFSFVPNILESQFSLARENHWRLYSPIVLFSIIGLFFIIKLSKKFEYNEKLYFCALVVFIFSTTGLMFADNFYIFSVLFLLFFLMFNLFEASLPVSVARVVARDDRGAALGVFASSQFFGTFLGGFFGGWFSQTGFIAGAGILIPAIIWFFWQFRLFIQANRRSSLI